MLARFQDTETGTLYQADADVKLLTRKSDATDGSEPAGPGRALQLLCRLRALGAPSAPTDTIDKILLSHASLLSRAPRAAVSVADAADRLSRKSTEVVIATPTLDHPKAQAMISAFNKSVRPHTVLAVVTEDQASQLQTMTAILGKTAAEDGPRAFVCHDGVCLQPTSDVDALSKLLSQSPH
jgi:uncharacterized protein YyaL (SSP411 family)